MSNIIQAKISSGSSYPVITKNTTFLSQSNCPKGTTLQAFGQTQRIVNNGDIEELQCRSAQATATQSTSEDRLVFTTPGSVTTKPTATSTNVNDEDLSTGDLSDKENHTAEDSKPAAST